MGLIRVDGNMKMSESPKQELFRRNNPIDCRTDQKFAKEITWRDSRGEFWDSKEHFNEGIANVSQVESTVSIMDEVELIILFK
ncbi:unnamed protein product [Caenorhabditis angaria]|uniref:Uncharacterized protein n=1 Tax=Caenorhabditis angaria TaxID=860376 RepID=A0A9P1IA05_9PELO|nr:unnamed protein product [Caenorhabditis angaria]